MIEKYYLDEPGLRELKTFIDEQLDSKAAASALLNLVTKEELNQHSPDLSDYATKNYVSAAISGFRNYDDTELRNAIEELEAKTGGLYHYKGTVENLAALEAIAEPEVGDTYNLLDTGMNAAWTGEVWDKFGSVIDLSAYAKIADIQSIAMNTIKSILYNGKSAAVTNVEAITAMIANDEPEVAIVINKDIATDSIIQVPAGKKITIDLGGNNFEGDGANVLLINGNVTLKNGTISGSNRTIVVQNGGSLTLDGATVISTGSNAIGATGEGSTVTVNSGDISAQEYGVILTDGADAVINGGYIVGNDNFAIGGNGSKRLNGADHDQLPINVTINGGRLEGQIQSPGYIATAIYWPNAGTLTINGGEILGQTGIVQRAGNIIINEGAKITANGEAGLLGKAGDSRIVVGPHAIVVDKESNYPNSEGMSLTINHGAQLISENGDEINTIPADYTTDIIDNR